MESDDMFEWVIVESRYIDRFAGAGQPAALTIFRCAVQSGRNRVVAFAWVKFLLACHILTGEMPFGSADVEEITRLELSDGVTALVTEKL